MMLQKTMVATLIVVALVIGACAPQTAPAPAQPAQPAQPAAPAQPAQPAAPAQPAQPAQPGVDTQAIDPELAGTTAIRATSLLGLNVNDTAGQNVGVVDDAFVIVENGQIQYLVVTAGGLTGAFTDWMLPLPWNSFNIDPQFNAIVVASDVARLAEAPGWERAAWPDTAAQDWDANIRTFWGDLTAPAAQPAQQATPLVEEEADDVDVEGTPTPLVEEEADDADVEGTPTPVAEEEADDADVEGTPTPVAEEEADDADVEGTPTPVAEEEADDADAEGTPTPVAEEEVDDADVEGTPTPVAEEEAAVVPAEQVTPVAEGEDDLTVRMPHALSLNQLLDFDVHDATGENLGAAEDIVIDWNDGRIRYIVLSFGGFLGLGDNWYAIPWGELIFDPLNNAFVTSLTQEQLEAMPGFDPNAWPDIDDPTWDTQIQDYWQQ